MSQLKKLWPENNTKLCWIHQNSQEKKNNFSEINFI